MLDFHPHTLASSAKILGWAIYTRVTSAAKLGDFDWQAHRFTPSAIAPKISSAVNDKIPPIPQLLSQDHQDFILSPYQVIGGLFAPPWLPDHDKFCR
ncbi:hypothetical protein [Limnospira platensis]|uniref:hypothetical protein n=1 Tax=Limnospira platensis TaxID=118562 RepID=UPI0001C385C1|nr:hypothetical protein AP285_01355 [Arthrospira platensis YZ]WAK74177.1 hypothetical protein AP9108_32660 [Arthrospira sp. PCC 9108]